MKRTSRAEFGESGCFRSIQSGAARGALNMSWDRRGEKRYYYRGKWQNGRAKRTYFGAGAAAQLAATADELRRVEREIEARQRRQDQERRASAEDLLNHLCEQSDVLVRTALIVAGYHQHDRGAWRRKRERNHSDSEI